MFECKGRSLPLEWSPVLEINYFRKKFYNTGPGCQTRSCICLLVYEHLGVNVIKLFFFANDAPANKLERLQPDK